MPAPSTKRSLSVAPMTTGKRIRTQAPAKRQEWNRRCAIGLPYMDPAGKAEEISTIAASWTRLRLGATVAGMACAGDQSRLEASLVGHGEYELFACDPALADTGAFCAAYGFALEDAANTIVVVGKSDPPRYAACIVLATHRLDVNRTIRDRLGTRRGSFGSAAGAQGADWRGRRGRGRGGSAGGPGAVAAPTGSRSGWVPGLGTPPEPGGAGAAAAGRC